MGDPTLPASPTAGGPGERGAHTQPQERRQVVLALALKVVVKALRRGDPGGLAIRSFPEWRGKVRHWPGLGCRLTDLITLSLLSLLPFSPQELFEAICSDRRFRVFTVDAAEARAASTATPLPSEGLYVTVSGLSAASARGHRASHRRRSEDPIRAPPAENRAVARPRGTSAPSQPDAPAPPPRPPSDHARMHTTTSPHRPAP